MCVCVCVCVCVRARAFVRNCSWLGWMKSWLRSQYFSSWLMKYSALLLWNRKRNKKFPFESGIHLRILILMWNWVEGTSVLLLPNFLGWWIFFLRIWNLFRYSEPEFPLLAPQNVTSIFTFPLLIQHSVPEVPLLTQQKFYVYGSVHRESMSIIAQQNATICSFIIFMQTALHVSGDTFTNHQELI